MEKNELIVAVFSFVLAGIMLAISILQFMEKGFLFNNAFLYASKQERETMDKKPHYRQSAITFGMCSAAFFIIGFSIVLDKHFLLLADIPFGIGIIAYAVISSWKIDQKTKELKK